MDKILIIGPSFFCYNHSIGCAFEELEYVVRIMEYDEPIHPFSLKNKILNKCLPRNKGLKKKCRSAFNKSVVNIFTEFNPSLVFVYNGDILDTETILIFKKTSKVAIWALDGIKRHPQSEALAPFADAYFCFEESDVEYLKSKGIHSYFLPQACDTNIYHPINIKKDIDILFVGTLYAYPNRIRILRRVVATFSRYNIQIYGVYKPWYKNPFKWLFREHRRIYKNCSVPPEEVNLLYNRARICINMHHAQSKNGANPKVFEISGSGAFQLVDWNPYIESVFSNSEVAMYHSEDELMEMIEYYLHQDNTESAEKAYRLIMEKHTFVNRISNVLKILDFRKC